MPDRAIVSQKRSALVSPGSFSVMPPLTVELLPVGREWPNHDTSLRPADDGTRPQRAGAGRVAAAESGVATAAIRPVTPSATCPRSPGARPGVAGRGFRTVPLTGRVSGGRPVAATSEWS